MIAVALALQTTLARFLTPGANLIDLVFVAVVYIALTGRTGGRAGRGGGGGPGAGCPGGDRHVGRLPSARGGRRRAASSASAGWPRPLWGLSPGSSAASSSSPAPAAGAGLLHSDGRPCDHIPGALSVLDPGYVQTPLRRDLQPGGCKRAGRRAAVSDYRILPGFVDRRRSIGRRHAESTGAGSRTELELNNG